MSEPLGGTVLYCLLLPTIVVKPIKIIETEIMHTKECNRLKGYSRFYFSNLLVCIIGTHKYSNIPVFNILYAYFLY